MNLSSPLVVGLTFILVVVASIVGMVTAIFAVIVGFVLLRTSAIGSQCQRRISSGVNTTNHK